MAKQFRTLSDRVTADPRRRERVETHKLAIRDSLALAQLREQCGRTQGEIAEVIGTSQANVSRIEGQGDLYLSTLSNYIAALGGQLELVAVFPDQRIHLTQPAPESGSS